MEARDKIRSKGFYSVLGGNEWCRLSHFSVKVDRKSVSDEKNYLEKDLF